MDTSSESESYGRKVRGHRARGRETHRRSIRDRRHVSGGRDDGRAAEISDKISTLADTLQDTSRNLTKVDKMLGQYRDHADDQAEAMTLVRHVFYLLCMYLKVLIKMLTWKMPTLLGTPIVVCLSQTIHLVHQTLRDLCSDQQRLSEDLDREILRRNRYLLLLTALYSTLQFTHGVEWSFQSRGQTERREMEALVLESTRSRNELKTRAQEAVRQWRAKCRRLQKELEDAEDSSRKLAKPRWLSARALSQQAEASRRELGEALGRLSQCEEELHRKGVELSEAHQRQLALQQEIREQESQRQTSTIARLREENHILEEQADVQARRLQRDQEAKADLQTTLKQMTAAHAQLSLRLTDEENTRKDVQRATTELQAKLTLLQEERTTLSQQLQLEREVHQKELNNMAVTVKDDRTRKDREVQEMLRLCRQENDELSTQLREVKADAASDKELRVALHIKLDKMKDECDKLVAQLHTKDGAHSLLQRKYQQLKQELKDKVSQKKIVTMEADRETVLASLGEELDEVCRGLARNGQDKLITNAQTNPEQQFQCTHFSFSLHATHEPNQTKLRWLSEEVRERDTKERRLRKQHQQTRDELKVLRQSRDSEQETLLQRMDQQEKLLLSLSTEKKGTLEHLESVPEKQCLLDDFKDFEESRQQMAFVEQRCGRYREIVRDLQDQLDESKRRIQEYREEKLDATSRSLRLAALSSSIKGPSTFPSSTVRPDCLCECASLSLWEPFDHSSPSSF
uniref:Centrosomal protein 128 n=1 Tax=Xiphophorus couchianus TaxID=32473 RepID=A0A3B5LKE4_9TELE